VKQIENLKELYRMRNRLVFSRSHLWSLGEEGFERGRLGRRGMNMERYSGWTIAIALAFAALPLNGCQEGTAKTPASPPASVQKQESGISRIMLTARAAERLGIEFAEVTKTGRYLEAPYNTLLYDASGNEWVFISPQPNVFTRTPVKVELIEGEKMYYSQGPEAGTKLVTSGVAQLYGIEFGVGK
jgi:hypothetical protein